MANWVAEFLATNPAYQSYTVERRAKHSISFRRPDGKTETLIVGPPMHYQNGPNWEPVDTALRDIGGGVMSGLGTPSAVYPDGSLRIRGGTFQALPKRIVRYRPSTGGVSAISNIPGLGSSSGDTYTRTGTGWTYTVRITEDGAVVRAVLAAMPTFPGGTQDTDYICIEEQVSGITFPDGEIPGDFSLDGYLFFEPRIWSQSGRPAPTKRFARTSGGVQYILTGTTAAWLSNPLRYPVTIDPDYAADAGDGDVEGRDASTYATARSTSTTHGTGGTYFIVGQTYEGGKGGLGYRVWRDGTKYDTSTIPDTDTVSQVNEKLTIIVDASDTDFDIQTVKQNWSGQDPLSASNREAFFDNALSGTQDVVFRNTSGIVVNTQYTSPNMDTSYVNKTGYTYYNHRSSRDAGSNTPTGNEYVQIAAQDHGTSAYRPVLAVVHAAGGGVTLTAALSFAGVAQKQNQQHEAGVLSFAGVAVKSVRRTLASVLSFGGDLASQIISGTIAITLTAALSFAGAVTKTTGLALSGVSSFSGALGQQGQRVVSGVLSFGGTIGKATSATTSSALSFSGAITKATTASLAGALSFGGNLVKQGNLLLGGVASFVGSVGQGVATTVSAALSFGGEVVKQPSLVLPAALSFTGAVSKAATATLSSTLSLTGNLVKTAYRNLSGVLIFEGALGVGGALLTLTLTAALSFAGALTKATSRTVDASLTFGGAITKTVSRTLTGVLSWVGEFAKWVTRHGNPTVTVSNTAVATLALSNSAVATLSLSNAAVATLTVSNEAWA